MFNVQVKTFTTDKTLIIPMQFCQLISIIDQLHYQSRHFLENTESDKNLVFHTHTNTHTCILLDNFDKQADTFL